VVSAGVAGTARQGGECVPAGQLADAMERNPKRAAYRISGKVKRARPRWPALTAPGYGCRIPVRTAPLTREDDPGSARLCCPLGTTPRMPSPMP
jgi:hypothetical protein